MITIVQGKQDLRKLLSQPPAAAGVLYVPTAYVLRRDTVDGVLLCSTLTGELVLLSPEEADAYAQLPTVYTEALDRLIRHHFAVPAGSREAQTVEQLRALLLRRRENRGIISSYNILPTTHCNARCFYCYESGIRQTHMSAETADALADFITAHCGGQKVRLNWFGGEPTLGAKCIDHISGRLAERGIPYDAVMTSNGYLFDEALVAHARDVWKLKSIQITLDGTEEIYNQTKAYLHAEGSPFRRVWRNIRLFVDAGIRVDVRLNLDRHNAEDLGRLIDALGRDFSGQRTLVLPYVCLLDEGEGYAPLPHSQGEREALKEQLVLLQRQLGRYGWRPFSQEKLPSLRLCSCMADDPCAIQCTPDGILSKCESQIDQHTVGTLAEGVTERSEVLWWRERRAFNGCETCPLYPCCIRMLKNCPVKTERCAEYEKSSLLKRSLELMDAAWVRWKETEAKGDAEQK